MTRPRCTPGFLRGAASAQIIDALHTRAEGGNWELVRATTTEDERVLTFAVGTVYPEQPDNRQKVRVVIWEEPA